MSEKGKSKVSIQAKHIPNDAQVIMTILKEVGITDYEPRVVNLLLDFTYRYVTSVLDDARVFATHSKKKTIDLEDVRMAVQMQLDKSFTSPPPREVLLEISREKNFNPLPIVKTDCGLRLPPDRYCLSSCNYRLKPAAKKATPKPTISSVAESLMSVRSIIPPPTQNVVVRRPPGAIVIVGAPKSNYRLNDAVKKAAPKPSISPVSTVETDTTSKPPPGLEVISRLVSQNVVVNRPPAALANVAAPKHTVIPQSILKFTFGTKVVAKPAVRVTAGPSAHTPVKMELDEQVGQKRKCDDDDDDCDL